MSQLSKKTLEYLAELARLEIKEKKEEKLLKDLQEILAYFEELKEVDTENIEPMAGGTRKTNVLRKDEESIKHQVSSIKLKEAFPEKERDFLKIPPVFE